MSKTKQPTPETHPNLFHVDVYKVYKDQEGIVREGKKSRKIYDPKTYRQLLARDGFKGFATEIVHDPTKAAKTTKTRTRKPA